MKSLFVFIVKNGGYVEKALESGDEPGPYVLTFCQGGFMSLSENSFKKLFDANYLTQLEEGVWIPNVNHPDYPSLEKVLVRLIAAARPVFEKYNIDIDELWPRFDTVERA